jgi:Tfp pilus assembly PilM family ATPase
MARRIGLEIAATAVRAVEVKGLDVNADAVVTRAAIVPLPEGTIVAGTIRKPTELALAMVQALKAIKAPRQGVVVGLATPQLGVARREVNAGIRLAERDTVLRFQGEDIALTVALADSALASHADGEAITPDGQALTSITVAAIDRAELDTLIAVCKLARITPKAIELAPVALCRALARTGNSNEISTIVDIGATQTTVVTRAGRRVRSIRTVRGGGHDVTRAIAEATGEDRGTAEARKPHLRVGLTNISADLYATYGEGTADDRASVIDAAVNSAIETIVDVVAQSVDSDTSRYGARTEGVGLSGGVALTPGMSALLAQRLDLPVQVSLPWAVITPTKFTSHLFDGESVPAARLIELSTAIGLALWEEPA